MHFLDGYLSPIFSRRASVGAFLKETSRTKGAGMPHPKEEGIC
jgi:hypothetical protein